MWSGLWFPTGTTRMWASALQYLDSFTPQWITFEYPQPKTIKKFSFMGPNEKQWFGDGPTWVSASILYSLCDCLFKRVSVFVCFPLFPLSSHLFYHFDTVTYNTLTLPHCFSHFHNYYFSSEPTVWKRPTIISSGWRCSSTRMGILSIRTSSGGSTKSPTNPSLTKNINSLFYKLAGCDSPWKEDT